MALNQFFSQIFKYFKNFKISDSGNKVINLRYSFYLFSLVIILIFFFLISNFIKQKNQAESQNFNSIVKTKDFYNLSEYFVSKINSPYNEIEYVIKNNEIYLDTVYEKDYNVKHKE